MKLPQKKEGNIIVPEGKEDILFPDFGGKEMTKQLMSCIVDLAENMVCSGAEVYRVEESIDRMCKAYGVVRTDAYVTTSNMVITVQNADGDFHTHSRRISGTSMDIEKLHRLNNLVREICKNPPDTETFKAKIEEVLSCKHYSVCLQVAAYSGIAGFFTVFFGGRQPLEILISFIIGAIVGVLVKASERNNVNRIMVRFVCSAVSSILAFTALKAGLIDTPDNIIIGNIMSLIPGVGMTNSLRDLFAGDTMTGIFRAIEAVLLSCAMVLGYFLAAFLFGGAL